LTSKEQRIKRAHQLFDWISSSNKITIAPPTIFKLSEGKKAHDYLESRKVQGK
jgi:NADPH2:quinone reductase